MSKPPVPRIIHWGMIGCGSVTEVKSGPAFQKAEGSSLVAVMGRNAERARDWAARHKVAKWYSDADKLIEDPEVDAVYVATPPSSHKEYALRVARAGKPAYVEKPMALNHAECLEMVRAFEAAGVPLFVAYYRRSQPRFLKIKDLIDEGAIGKVRHVSIAFSRKPDERRPDPAVNWRIDPAVAGGGYFVDLACHMLDFLDYSLGIIVEANGLAGNQAGLYPAEDTVTGTFRFSSGVQGVGTWCFCARNALDRTEIHGTRGTISYACFDDSPVVLQTETGVEQFTIPYPAHVQRPLIQTIVDELNGRGRCPSHGESAARTTWVMDRLLQRPGQSLKS
jgi:1,5-anhydro-D-fructose reductase (1,5-anhydro-D-mannitol-forming)